MVLPGGCGSLCDKLASKRTCFVGRPSSNSDVYGRGRLVAVECIVRSPEDGGELRDSDRRLADGALNGGGISLGGIVFINRDNLDASAAAGKRCGFAMRVDFVGYVDDEVGVEEVPPRDCTGATSVGTQSRAWVRARFVRGRSRDSFSGDRARFALQVSFTGCVDLVADLSTRVVVEVGPGKQSDGDGVVDGDGVLGRVASLDW